MVQQATQVQVCSSGPRGSVPWHGFPAAQALWALWALWALALAACGTRADRARQPSVNPPAESKKRGPTVSQGAEQRHELLQRLVARLRAGFTYRYEEVSPFGLTGLVVEHNAVQGGAHVVPVAVRGDVERFDDPAANAYDVHTFSPHGDRWEITTSGSVDAVLDALDQWLVKARHAPRRRKTVPGERAAPPSDRAVASFLRAVVAAKLDDEDGCGLPGVGVLWVRKIVARRKEDIRRAAGARVVLSFLPDDSLLAAMNGETEPPTVTSGPEGAAEIAAHVRSALLRNEAVEVPGVVRFEPDVLPGGGRRLRYEAASTVKARLNTVHAEELRLQ